MEPITVYVCFPDFENNLRECGKPSTSHYMVHKDLYFQRLPCVGESVFINDGTNEIEVVEVCHYAREALGEIPGDCIICELYEYRADNHKDVFDELQKQFKKYDWERA